MPRVDSRGRPSTAPAARTRSLPTLRAAPEGQTSGVFDLTSVSEPNLQGADQAEPGSDGARQRRDVVTIEYCTVHRPTMTLRGTPEKFETHALALKAFLEETFPSASVLLQRAPYNKRSKIPSTEIEVLRRHLTPQEKALSAHPRLRYADRRVYVPTDWDGGKDGRGMPTSAEGRRRFPRINAFEVVANGQTVFSKLAGGPTAPFPRVVDGAYVDIAARLAKVFARPQIAGLEGVVDGVQGRVQGKVVLT